MDWSDWESRDGTERCGVYVMHVSHGWGRNWNWNVAWNWNVSGYRDDSVLNSGVVNNVRLMMVMDHSSRWVVMDHSCLWLFVDDMSVVWLWLIVVHDVMVMVNDVSSRFWSSGDVQNVMNGVVDDSARLVAHSFMSCVLLNGICPCEQEAKSNGIFHFII